MTMKRLLVTGGAGFIGSNYIRFILNHRPELQVTNIDCLSYSGNLDNLTDVESDPRYTFVEANISDRSVIQTLVDENDAVVHFAAESHVDRSICDATPFVQTNVHGTQVLLDAIRNSDGTRMVHVSTD